MQPSIFNLRVPLRGRDEVFLMNTLTDAQLVVSSDVAQLLEQFSGEAPELDLEAREAASLLAEHGFLVESREADRAALDAYFARIRHDTDELQVTILTTLQCNFACDYCFQGDHGDHNKFADKMTLETSRRVAAWIEGEIDRVAPQTLLVTFFGGEPLLNLPVMYDLAERLFVATSARDIRLAINIITNGLLLTPDIVDRLAPLGLNGIKITLDGDRDTHNRMRPLRGGQGTFDRIVENIRRVAGRCSIAIGGNFDESSVDSYPALLDFLREQDFADKLVKVNFKPVVRSESPAASPPVAHDSSRAATGVSRAGARIPLTPVNATGKPLNGTCMTSAGAGGAASPCDNCDFLDDKMAFLRSETRRRGLPTVDGVHMGPCQLHKAHSHTIGPDGSLYACPGFTGERGLSTGHIDGHADPRRADARARFDRIGPWQQCGDCAFIPVCAGGCSVASHTQLGDMNAPTCHKRSFESALTSLAEEAATAA
jgi:uncharacterized protein